MLMRRSHCYGDIGAHDDVDHNDGHGDYDVMVIRDDDDSSDDDNDDGYELYDVAGGCNKR